MKTVGPPKIPDHELLRRIGVGSYGEVWLARNVMGTYRAVKVVYREAFEHQRPYDREFEGIRKFEPISRQHETQIDVLHIGRNDEEGYFYYVLELADSVEGPGTREAGAEFEDYVPRTLKHDLNERGRLPLDECTRIGLALTTALEHLHQHDLVHRDIKPSNIIFVNGLPKLADIGLVASMNETLSMVGTAGYIPPEGPGTPLADIYSLGKVLYEMSMGRDRQEFPKLPAGAVDETASAELLEFNAVLLKACENEPSRRYQSARELGADLQLLQSGKSVKRLRVLEHRLALGRRVGLILLAVLLVAGGVVYQSRKAARAAREQLSRMHVASGARLTEDGNLFGALLHYTEAMRHDSDVPERTETHRIRIGTMLQQLPKPIGFFTHDEGAVYDASLSPDGIHVLTMGEDQTVRVWDIKSGEERQTLAHESRIVHAAFGPDGRYIVKTTADHQAHVWDFRQGDWRVRNLPHKFVLGMLDYYTITKSEERLSLWKGATIRFLEHTSVGQENVTLVFSLEGKGKNVRVHTEILDTETKESLFHRSVTDTPAADEVAWGPDEHPDNLLGSAGYFMLGLVSRYPTSERGGAEAVFDDAEVRLYDTASGACFSSETLDDFEDGQLINWAKFEWKEGYGQLEESGGRLTIRSRGDQGSHYVDGQMISRMFELQKGSRIEFRVRLVSLSEGGVFVGFVIPSLDHFNENEPLGCFPAISPDGRLLATLSDRYHLEIRDLTTGQLLGRVLEHEAKVQDLFFSQDGRWIVTSTEKQVRFWDPQTGEPSSFSFPCSGPVCVRLSSDGELLAVAQRTKLTLWDVEAHKQAEAPIKTTGQIVTVAFTDGGDRLLVTYRDRAAQIWDVGAGAVRQAQRRGAVLSEMPSPSWPNADRVFALQETTTLMEPSWTSARSGTNNPVTLSVLGPAKFFRLEGLGP